MGKYLIIAVCAALLGACAQGLEGPQGVTTGIEKNVYAEAYTDGSGHLACRDNKPLALWGMDGTRSIWKCVVSHMVEVAPQSASPYNNDDAYSAYGYDSTVLVPQYYAPVYMGRGPHGDIYNVSRPPDHHHQAEWKGGWRTDAAGWYNGSGGWNSDGWQHGHW